MPLAFSALVPLVKPIIEGLAKLAALLFVHKAGKDSVKLDLAEKTIDQNKKNEEIDRTVSDMSDVAVLAKLRKKYRRDDPNKGK